MVHRLQNSNSGVLCGYQPNLSDAETWAHFTNMG